MNSLFLLHGVTLALVWFLGVNAAATLSVVALAGRLARQDQIRTKERQRATIVLICVNLRDLRETIPRLIPKLAQY